MICVILLCLKLHILSYVMSSSYVRNRISFLTQCNTLTYEFFCQGDAQGSSATCWTRGTHHLWFLSLNDSCLAAFDVSCLALLMFTRYDAGGITKALREDAAIDYSAIKVPFVSCCSVSLKPGDNIVWAGHLCSWRQPKRRSRTLPRTRKKLPRRTRQRLRRQRSSPSPRHLIMGSVECTRSESTSARYLGMNGTVNSACSAKCWER